MPQDLSIIRLVLQASIPVQIVIGLLVFASLMSWAIIFSKRMMIRRARHEADEFESSFWSGGDLAQLYRGIESRGVTGMASIFEFGFREFARMRQQGSVPADQLLEAKRCRPLGARRTGHEQLVIEPGGSPVVDAEAHDGEHDAGLGRERVLREPQGAQPFGARALEEAQVVRVVDDPATVGVLPVHARRPAERTHLSSSNSCRLALTRCGTGNPRCR